MSEVAEALGKSPNAVAMTRRSLIRKGMIYAPHPGGIAYTVPMFGTYIRRVMPEKES